MVLNLFGTVAVDHSIKEAGSDSYDSDKED